MPADKALSRCSNVLGAVPPVPCLPKLLNRAVPAHKMHGAWHTGLVSQLILVCGGSTQGHLPVPELRVTKQLRQSTMPCA